MQDLRHLRKLYRKLWFCVYKQSERKSVLCFLNQWAKRAIKKHNTTIEVGSLLGKRNSNDTEQVFL
jgi:hypothetical protein